MSWLGASRCVAKEWRNVWLQESEVPPEADLRQGEPGGWRLEEEGGRGNVLHHAERDGYFREGRRKNGRSP
jgi:hypothetical protein